MPLESQVLNHKPIPLGHCPRCDATPFEPFMRGGVLRWRRRWLIGRLHPRSAIICQACRSIVGWESAEADAYYYGLTLRGVYERPKKITAYDPTTNAAMMGKMGSGWTIQPGETAEFRVPLTKGYQGDPATRPATMTPPPGAGSQIVTAKKTQS